MREAGDSGVRRAIFALLVAGLAVAIWWLVGAGGADVATPEEAGPVAPATAPRPDAGAGDPAAAVAPIERRQVAEPGVRGQLLDHLGEPVPHCTLQLTAAVGSWSQRVVLDEHGRFAVKECPAGELHVHTIPMSSFAAPFTKCDGEGLELALQLPRGLVAVHGTFDLDWSRRRAAAVQVILGGKPRRLALAPDSRHHAILDAGDVRFDLVRSLGEMPACSHSVTLPIECGQVEWHAPLRCQDLRVDVEGPVGEATVRIERVGGGYVREGKVKASRYVWMTLLPPGDYDVSLSGRYVAEQPSRRVTLLATAGERNLVLVAQRVATVRLLFEARGRVHSTDPDNMPVLLSAPGTGDERRHPWQAWGQQRWGEYGYVGVPPGRARIISRDRLVDGSWHYLAFDPVDDFDVEVLAHREAVAPLRVEARAFVDLRACHRSGREQVTATVEVYAGDVPVHSRGTRCSQFQGHLPVGDYRVVVDRGGQRSETGLTVGRRDVRLRLRP